jgi:protein-S-isoprenylcysteine O-methyltransferase Ste14
MNILRNRFKTSWLFCALLGGYYLFGTALWQSQYPVLEETLFLFGVILVAIGVIGRAWCFSYISGNKDERLIQEGPYSICRNPLYLFSLIGAVGIGFGTETFVVPGIIAVAFMVYYPFTIRREEAKLKEIFGAEYEDYLKKVPRRLVPSLRNYIELETLQISPKAFRRGVFDLVFFIIPLGLFEIVEISHVIGGIPIYFQLF